MNWASEILLGRNADGKEAEKIGGHVVVEMVTEIGDRLFFDGLLDEFVEEGDPQHGKKVFSEKEEVGLGRE